MNSKIKLLMTASLVTVLASGCSNGIYRSGGNQGVDSGSSGAPIGQMSRVGQVSRGGQVSGDGQVSGESRRGRFFSQQARSSATCAPCAANTSKAPPQSTYTYTPAPKATPTPKKAPIVAGQHSQQWYVDRWKREQAAGKTQPKQNTNYSGYGTGNYTYDAASSNNTNYYDYSTAGKTPNTDTNTNANVSTSNKSIYTGSYQQKTYKPYNPTTYSGGSSATTNTASAGSENTYTVKKGDTVFEIMRQTGVYWKDIIRINNLQAPAYSINPGQIIRLK